MADYFVIDGCSGDVSVTRYSKKELLTGMKEGEFGVEDGVGFVLDLSKASGDPFTWGNRVCIIRGELVEPKPVKEVTVWDV